MNEKIINVIKCDIYGVLEKTKINFNDLINTHELTAINNKYNFNLSCAVKNYDEYEEDEDIILNRKLNRSFNRNDLTGECYLLLDECENYDELLNKIYNDLEEYEYLGI